MRPDTESAAGGSAHRHAGRPGMRALVTVVVAAGSLGLLLWVAPPADVLRTIAHMDPGWVAGAVGFELASCLSYVILFRRFFPEPPRTASRQVAWISMGAGAVLPGGNISSAAATGLLLRRYGIGVRGLAERCGALLCLLTAFGFAINGLAGILLLLRVPGGPHDLSHAGVPILVSLFVLGGAWLIALVGLRWRRAPMPLRGVAAGMLGAWKMARRPHWRLLGMAGFLCLDMGALWAACAATGHPIGPFALAIAYCIGYLATIFPVPAGLGVLDSGLAASLVLYGMHPAAASVGAVLVYHLIAIWIPGLGGLAAWLPTRRLSRIHRPIAWAPPPLAPAESD